MTEYLVKFQNPAFLRWYLKRVYSLSAANAIALHYFKNGWRVAIEKRTFSLPSRDAMRESV